jgi:diacylglycerol kinase family enzyme
VEDFYQCVRELPGRCDVVVVAGGDGTLSDVLNAMDTSRIPIAFLPLGTGNAMQHALGYRGTLSDIARRIRKGEIREYDLVNCDDRKKAFMVSLGIDGLVIRLRSQYRARGASGFKTYLKATLNAYFKEYKRAAAKMVLDDVTIEMKGLLSLMVVKQPYYGFGMKVVPRARFDDGQLHVLCVNEGLLKAALGGMTAFTFENRMGQYMTGRRLTVNLERPLVLQIDGNEGWESEAFQFTVIPKGLKIKC